MCLGLSEVRKGDTLHFACGGKGTVSWCVYENDWLKANLKEWNLFGDDSWTAEGRYKSSPHPLDIVRVEAGPFDWKTVKVGMCFEYLDIYVYYVGPSLRSPNKAIFFSDQMDLCSYFFDELKRGPSNKDTKPPKQ